MPMLAVPELSTMMVPELVIVPTMFQMPMLTGPTLLLQLLQVFDTVMVPELEMVPSFVMPMLERDRLQLLQVFWITRLPPLSTVMVSPLLTVIVPKPLISRVVPDGITRLFPEVV